MAVRKAVLFTTDAIFASLLILTAVIVYTSGAPAVTESATTTYLSEDLLQSLNQITLQQVLDPTIEDIINETILTENDSVLYAIGLLWAINDSRATEVSAILNASIPNRTRVTLSIEDEIIYQRGGNTTGQVRSLSRQQITGIDEGEPLDGSSGTAFLRRLRDKFTSSYTYFGGFVGQGDIRVLLDLPDDVNGSDIDEFYMLGDVTQDFEVFINDVSCANHSPSSGNMTADFFDLSGCTSLVGAGDEYLNITFDDLSDAFIAGGYIRIDYVTDSYVADTVFDETVYTFPEISGVANLYDAIRIPQQVRNISATLHYETDSANTLTYLSVGEKTVYESNATGEVTVTLDADDFTDAGVTFDELSNTTIPLRFASYNASVEVIGQVANADVVIITDYSGSMQAEIDSDFTGDVGDLTDCEGDVYTNPDIRRSHLARCLDKDLVENLLNYTGNRVYPIHFYNNEVYTYVNPEDEEAITSFYETYTSTFPSDAAGGTGLASALSAAYDVFDTHSSENRTKVIVFMTDGLASHCSLDPDVYWQPGPWWCAWFGCGSWEPSADVSNPQCDNRDTEFHVQSSCSGTQSSGNCQVGGACSAPLSNTEQVALDIHNDFNATIHTVAFGPIGSCDAARVMLENVAALTNGTYYSSSNISGLIDSYTNISESIISVLELSSQSVVVPGNITFSTLYGDSEIVIEHDPVILDIAQNEIELTRETDQFGSCNPTWNIPAGARVKEAIFTSYSGEHWTDYLSINGVELFNLSQYLVSYSRLGDPFSLTIPPSLVTTSNTLTINTGDAPDNSTGCSGNNSIIYTVFVPSSTSRTPVREFVDGCIWQIESESDGNQTITLPGNYAGADTCYYTSTQQTYNASDALQESVFTLLESLDFDADGRVFVQLIADDLEIVITQISSVPYLWGPVLMTVEVEA